LTTNWTRCLCFRYSEICKKNLVACGNWTGVGGAQYYYTAC